MLAGAADADAFVRNGAAMLEQLRLQRQYLSRLAAQAREQGVAIESAGVTLIKGDLAAIARARSLSASRST